MQTIDDEMRLLVSSMNEIVDSLTRKKILEGNLFQCWTTLNKHSGIDIFCNNYTLCVQLYKANSQHLNYLAFSTFQGFFDKDGYADAFAEIKPIEIFRFNYITDVGIGKWQDQEKSEIEYFSKELAGVFVNKFFSITLANKQ